MTATDDFSEQHEDVGLPRPIKADAEDQSAQFEPVNDNITSFPRQREQNTPLFAASDKLIDQIGRMEKLLEAQVKLLNDMQASFKEALAGQLSKQSYDQRELLLSLKEAMIEQRDQMSRMQASLMGTIAENSKMQISLLGAMIEQRDQMSRMQAFFAEQARFNGGIGNQANQYSLHGTQSAGSEQEQNGQAAIHHITCMVATPFKDHEDTFAYESVLLPALRYILERPPYCWQVIRADEIHFEDMVQDNIRRLMKQADAYVVDISDENPNVMMELGYMLWSRKPGQPLVVLKREGTGRYLADLAGYFLKTYPAKATGGYAINEVSDALKQAFHDHKPIQALNKTKRSHYLSPVFLQKDYETSEEIAKSLSDEFTTMEAVKECSQEDYDRRTVGIQRNQADGARNFILDELQKLRTSEDKIQ